MQRPQRIEPGEGQESVWDYPRPPRVEPLNKRVRVIFNGVTIADSDNAKRVLETSHPPGIYIPPQNVKMDALISTGKRTFCEFKGQASYWTVRVEGKEAKNAAWAYMTPVNDYETIRGYISFYPGLMDTCYIGEELVKPQAGNFYGGWITSDVVGPFKGEPGTLFW